MALTLGLREASKYGKKGILEGVFGVVVMSKDSKVGLSEHGQGLRNQRFEGPGIRDWIRIGGLDGARGPSSHVGNPQFLPATDGRGLFPGLTRDITEGR